MKYVKLIKDKVQILSEQISSDKQIQNICFLLDNIFQQPLDLQKLELNYILTDIVKIQKNIKVLKQCIAIDIKIEQSLKQEYNPTISEFIDISNKIHQFPHLFVIYRETAQKILDQSENTQELVKNNIARFQIIQQIENVKNSLFQVSKSEVNQKFLPPLNSFGLLPVTQSLDIEEISELLFKKQMTMDQFRQSLREQNYDLAVLSLFNKDTIEYNTLELLNFDKSKEFQNSISPEDGITPKFIQRYSNIFKHRGNKEQIKITSYTHSNNDFIIILRESQYQKYEIMSSKVEGPHFLRKVFIPEFINYLDKARLDKANDGRINDYNNEVNKIIESKMLRKLVPNIEKIKEEASAQDAKYLRFKLIQKFQQAVDKIKQKPTKLYDINTILYDEQFVKLYSETLADEFMISMKKQIKSPQILSEVFSSFLHNLAIYERDFKKKLVDLIAKNIDQFSSENYKKVFMAIVTEIIEKNINDKSNIFQALVYKQLLLDPKFLK